MKGRYNVLFLCTGNSARSIMAEAIMTYSAGSHPTGHVNPAALQQLEVAKLPTTGLRSKDWNEFARPDSPPLHLVFTVCDAAAKEVCPVWSGQPMTAHWGVPDPAAIEGSPEQIQRAFLDAFTVLDRRISCCFAYRLRASTSWQSKKKSTALVLHCPRGRLTVRRR